MTSPLPLDGVRVLEVSTSIAAAFAGHLLAGYGADVSVFGDPGVAEPAVAGLSDDERTYLHHGKRVIADTGALAGAAAVADILVEDLPPGRLGALGLDGAALRADHPGLVHVSVTPFGQDGPYAGFQSTNAVSFAMGGIMSLTGDPRREPLVTGGTQAHYLGGLNAFAAAVTAHLGVVLHGEGDRIDISMQECAASMLELYSPATAYGEPVAKRLGNHVRATWGIYPCLDGWTGVFALERQVPALFALMDDPELAEERFQDPIQRWAIDDEMEAKMYVFVSDKTKADLLASARAAKVPMGVVLTPLDLLDNEGLRDRAFFDHVDTPEGTATVPGRPFPSFGWRWADR